MAPWVAVSLPKPKARPSNWSAQKTFGDALLHPRALQTFLEEAYLFFFLAFFAAILFSSLLALESSASLKLAERVFNHHV